MSEKPEVTWHADLGWVTKFLAEERPTRQEMRLLEAVQWFLSTHRNARSVPLRERSLQLLGDEKALDGFLRGRLFAPRRLNLELLAAYRVSPPLQTKPVGKGPVTLLVENYTTFDSLARALPADGRVGRLVWAAGSQCGQVVPQLTEYAPQELAYFGDLDVRGLAIAASAARLADELDLAELLPAEGLYRLLLDVGIPAPVETVPDERRVREVCGWLPARLRAPVEELLSGGRRLAQEAVGLDVLTRRCPPLP